MRLPFAPLADAVGIVLYPQRVKNQYGMRDGAEWFQKRGYPTAVISELTGIGRRRLTRWQSAGVPEEEADRIACSLGLHPADIWGDAWWDSAPCSASLSLDYETVRP